MDGKKISSISQLNPTSRVSDGVGGALKRTADRIVDHGGNIPSAQGFYDKLKSVDTSVELFCVPEWEIESKPEVRVN